MLERRFLPITTPPKSGTTYGKKGLSSLAAQLASEIPENEFSPSSSGGEGERYGEIWMGDHPSNPSSIILDNGGKVILGKIISEEPERYLGKEVWEKFRNTQSGMEGDEGPGARGQSDGIGKGQRRSKGEEKAHLPFLFKILSFDRALPLQVHPDRKISARLFDHGKAHVHGDFGRLKYQMEVEGKGFDQDEVGEGGQLTDLNYKPEVAICLSERFDGFIGFRPLVEIWKFLGLVEEFKAVIVSGAEGGEGEDVVQKVLGMKREEVERIQEGEEGKRLLKCLVRCVVECEESVIVKECGHLQKRFLELGDEGVLGKGSKEVERGLGKVIRKCMKDFCGGSGGGEEQDGKKGTGGGDVGFFLAGFMMNHVVLKKGEGVLVGVDEIHAYVEGDIIECMAWGDNMLAYGFLPASQRSTPESFLSSISYQSHPHPPNTNNPNPTPPSLLLPTQSPWIRSHNKKTTLYSVPIDEFDILHIHLSHAGDSEEMTSASGPINGPIIFLALNGKAEIKLKSTSSPTSATHGRGRGRGDSEEGKDVQDDAESRVLERGRAIFVRPDTEWKITALGDGGVDIWGAFVEVSGAEQYNGRTYGMY